MNPKNGPFSTFGPQPIPTPLRFDDVVSAELYAGFFVVLLRDGLSRAANVWLAANDAYADCSIRFDVALVGADRSIDYLENAYEAVEYDDFCH